MILSLIFARAETHWNEGKRWWDEEEEKANHCWGDRPTPCHATTPWTVLAQCSLHDPMICGVLILKLHSLVLLSAKRPLVLLLTWCVGRVNLCHWQVTSNLPTTAADGSKRLLSVAWTSARFLLVSTGYFSEFVRQFYAAQRVLLCYDPAFCWSVLLLVMHTTVWWPHSKVRIWTAAVLFVYHLGVGNSK